MRRTLILGGTAWLGREIATQLLASGNAVTCLARGSSGSAPVGATLEAIDRSDPEAYDRVKQQEWDDVIELSYDQGFVTGALRALASQAAHWTLVSSVSVYSSNAEPHADETAEVVVAVNLSDYGHAKVAAEKVSTELVGDRLLIARPGLIGGPGDPSDRFGYWVGRFALADTEPVLSPTTKGRTVQVVDVRDLASWVASAGRGRLTGTFNVVGNQHGLQETLDRAATIAGYSGRTIEAPDEWLIEHAVNFWAGPRSLPLWLPEVDRGFTRRSNAAFISAGGVLRSLDDTLIGSLEYEQRCGLDRERRSGLSRHDELALLEILSR
ncbi:NAD-dependent epimerase/dehydratase family protein [Homoserinimonas sp. OAct 916]|uniref:NAD-dependent epimerase/dehydratase family protein n=1 Tax=Homoserinimonas sp. OAct 916 TaxID=2211450 RepID=UPI000DBE6B5A|nr:NAD-dependent epimerase/dehydratase family protein [Homoserinimonas sp. OAct 916]